jgi:hypothetical protein
MPQQEERGEDFGAGREILYGVQEQVGESVMRILAEFMLGEYPQHSIDLVWIHKEQDDTANDFEYAVHSLAY